MAKGMTIEKLFSHVCNNNKTRVKNYFEAGWKPNQRIERFGTTHSLIIGAIRNNLPEMVELLHSYGENVQFHELEEYNLFIKQYNIFKELY